MLYKPEGFYGQKLSRTRTLLTKEEKGLFQARAHLWGRGRQGLLPRRLPRECWQFQPERFKVNSREGLQLPASLRPFCIFGRFHFVCFNRNFTFFFDVFKFHRIVSRHRISPPYFLHWPATRPFRSEISAPSLIPRSAASLFLPALHPLDVCLYFFPRMFVRMFYSCFFLYIT